MKLTCCSQPDVKLLLFIRPDGGVDFSHIDVVKLLHGGLDLVFVGFGVTTSGSLKSFQILNHSGTYQGEPIIISFNCTKPQEPSIDYPVFRKYFPCFFSINIQFGHYVYVLFLL